MIFACCGFELQHSLKNVAMHVIGCVNTLTAHPIATDAKKWRFCKTFSAQNTPTPSAMVPPRDQCELRVTRIACRKIGLPHMNIVLVLFFCTFEFFIPELQKDNISTCVGGEQEVLNQIFCIVIDTAGSLLIKKDVNTKRWRPKIMVVVQTKTIMWICETQKIQLITMWIN